MLTHFSDNKKVLDYVFEYSPSEFNHMKIDFVSTFDRTVIIEKQNFNHKIKFVSTNKESTSYDFKTF